MKGWLHGAAHLFGWNTGVVVSTYDKHGNLWMAFRCSGCGRVTGKELNSFCHTPPSDEDFKQ